MNQSVRFTPKHQAAVLGLLGLAIFVPAVLSSTTALSWVPGWTGAVIAIAALLGALVVFWRAGAMRLGYIVVFVVALVLAALFA